MEKELVILIDSAAAIRRLTWYRRKDFRPHPRKTKDFNIVREIIESLDERGRNGACTTMVKVHGHTGEPLHAVAEALATERANRKMEDEERPLYEIPGPKNLICMFKEGDNGREARGQWSPKVKTNVREHEAAVTGWIGRLTPHCYLVARTYKKWRMKADDSCLCGEGAETFLHMQLACKLKSRRSAIQGAHDVMRVLEEEVMREATPDRRGVWDTRVKDLCLQILSVADKEIMVRKWKGQLGGPIMDEDFEKWHLVMRQRWTRMSEGRSKASGEERQGQCTRSEDMWTKEAERRRSK